MRLLAALLALSAYSHGVSSQNNIVPNGSFEDYSQCPWLPDQMHFADYWSSTGPLCSPDYFNACCEPSANSPRVGVPENVVGYQHARSGFAYAGFYAYQGPYPDDHEFIQAELIQPIHAGVRYEVSFHVSLADKFGLAVGSIGAYFSEDELVRDDTSLPDVTPQIQSPEGVIYTDKEGWTEVRDTFVSELGGERFITIGNFLPDSLSNVTFVDSGFTNTHGIRSYYYIDDVSVIALDRVPNSIIESEGFHFSVFPNPATDIVRIRSRQPIGRIRLLDMLGREVLRRDARGQTASIDLSGIPAGLYLIEVSDVQGRKATERIIRTDGP